jgi:phage-related protein
MSGTLIPFLQNTVKPWLDTNIPVALQVLSDFWTNVLLPAIKAVWSWMTGTLFPLFGTLVSWLSTTITGALQVLSDFWAAHGESIKKTVSAMWDALIGLWEGFKSNIETAFELFHLAFEGDWYAFGEKLREIFDAAWEAIKEAVSLAWEAITSFVGNGIEDIKTKFKNTDWGAVGKGIIQGVADGIKASLQWLKDAAIAAAKAALEAAKGFLGIKSPSVLFAEVGENMMKGMAMGIMQSSNLPAMASARAAAGATQSVVNNSWSYTIQAANPLQSSDDLVRQVRLLELMHG